GLHVVRVVAAREVLHRVGRNRNAAIPLARLTTAASRRYRRATTAEAGAASTTTERRERIIAAAGRPAGAPAAAPTTTTLGTSGRAAATAPAAASTATAGGRAVRRRRWRCRFTTRLRLVHAHHAVVIVRNGAEVAGRPPVHEGVRVDAGHAPLGHLRQLPV